MVDKLQVGMSKTQVQYILGSPLVVDTFNPTRWDYYYTRVDAKSNKTKQQLTLSLSQDKHFLVFEVTFQ
jgi:outer membrane protein assembly factor BamE